MCLTKIFQSVAKSHLAYNPDRKQAIFTPFVIHTFIILSILFFLMITGRDYADYLLRDDGYYNIAANIAKGNFVSPGNLPPMLPIIFAPIHFFPEFLHPFIRIIISQFFVLIVLFSLYNITKKYLTNRQFLYGAILIVINPTFIQWTFRTSIDLYLAAFLGLFILYFLIYFNERKIFYLVLAFVAFGLGIFTRPSFIFIPFFLVLFSIFYFKSKNKIVVSVFLLLFSTSCFFLHNFYRQHNSTGQTEVVTDTGANHLFIHNLVLTEIIIETKQFHKGTIDNYNVPEEYYQSIDFESGGQYLRYRHERETMNYSKKHPEGNTLHEIYIYALKKPQVVLTKVLLGPVFFFALSSREIVSYILLLITILYMILTIWGWKINKLNLKKDNYLAIYFIILFGYFALHWATHAYSRYSLAILPFLFIWTGFAIEKILNRVSNKIQPKSM